MTVQLDVRSVINNSKTAYADFPFDLTGLYTNSLANKPNNNPSFHGERVMFDHNTDYAGVSVGWPAFED